VHQLYLLSVFIHIMAAMVWIGGMLFLVLVAIPWLRKGPRGQAVTFLGETGARFRNVGWTCFLLLAVTGTFNLWFRGVRLSDFGHAEWLGSPFGRTITVKLGLFVVVMVVSLAHDFVVGPRATRALQKDPNSPAAQTARRHASLLGRANLLLALLIVAAAVMLVRGVPW
jgi:copper resistance protein D